MECTLIGHACWLIKTDITILFDPLLYDPNQANCFEVHPSRTIDLKKFPRVDVIIISHRHLDHFDVRSLAQLPKSAEVLCPEDSLIVNALDSLGFTNVSTIENWTTVRICKTRITATPSENNVPEHGFVIESENQKVWNQVDTQISTRCIKHVNKIFGKLDVVICPWQPLLEFSPLVNASNAFPHRMYADLIAACTQVDTRLVVPGACGFRYIGKGKWLNRYTFPVSKARFLNDFRNVTQGEEIEVESVIPGDVIKCIGNAPTIARQTSHFVSTVEDDDSCLMFLPVDPLGEIVLAGTCDMPPQQVYEAGREFNEFLEKQMTHAPNVVETYLKWSIVYQLVVYNSHRSYAMWWDFSCRPIESGTGLHSRATMVTLIEQEAIVGLLAGKISWDEVLHSGRYRTFDTVAKFRDKVYFRPEHGEIFDIFRIFAPYENSLYLFIEDEIRKNLETDV